MIKDNKYNRSLIWTKSDSAQTHCFINHGDKFLQLQYFFFIQAINYYIVITHILITYTITQTIVFFMFKKKSQLCSPRLQLDKKLSKNSNIVKYYYKKINVLYFNIF